MSVLRDLIDTYKEVGKTLDTNQIYKGRNSFAKDSNKGVLYFPVLCSSSISLEEASMINKALERQYVSFVRILTSIDSVTTASNIDAYLKRLHQNFNTDGNGFLGEATSTATGSTFKARVFTNEELDLINHLNRVNSVQLSRLKEDSDDDIFEDDDDDLFEDDDDIIDINDVEDDDDYDDILQDVCSHKGKRYRHRETKSMIVENDNSFKLVTYFRDKGVVKVLETCEVAKDDCEVEDINNDEEIRKVGVECVKGLKEYESPIDMTILNDKFKPDNISIVSTDKALSNKYSTYGRKLSEDSNAKEVTVGDVKYRSVFDNNLTDNDVKKANELVPTTLHIKTYFKSEDDKLQAIDYLIGVKTTLHIIPSNAMVENMIKGVKRNRTFFNFIKWTSGEIAFFKDFVLTLDDIKSDIKTKYNDSPWWSALIRRRKYSKVLKALSTSKQLVPNSSIVLSMDEVVRIKNEYSVDLMNPKVAKDILNEYFLIGFVVVDSSVEVAHFLFDGQLNYMQQSYASLEKENSNQARDVKSIMQVLGKM